MFMKILEKKNKMKQTSHNFTITQIYQIHTNIKTFILTLYILTTYLFF
jgi:hypothetical protein